MKILRLSNGNWLMGRDLFRGFIKMALLICLVVSCVEAFYFMSELSKSSTNKHNYHYSRYSGYYNRSSTVDYTDDIEEVDDYDKDTTRSYTQQEYEY